MRTRGGELELPPAPSWSGWQVRDDGTREHQEFGPSEQEYIRGIDPATGKPDSRFDGTVTCAAPLSRTPAVHPAPDPSGLVEVARSSDLMIARDLGVGLGQLVEDDRLRSQAAEIRRSLEERYR